MFLQSRISNVLGRSSLLVITTYCGILLALFTSSATARSAAADKNAPPNIVILYADDMGYGDLGVQNSDSKIPTPHLDQLAKEGLRLTDAHSSSGICTPSRYALLTGRYHWRKFHGIVDSFGPSVFDAKELTLPEMLREKGYRTACIGKWHLGWDWNAIKREGAKPKAGGYAAGDFDWTKPIPNGPLTHGFDYYFGDDVPNFPPYAWIENDRIVEAPTVPYKPDPQPAEGAAEGRQGPMVAGWKQDEVMPTLTEKAVEWIAAQKGSGKPFFLYFPFTSPHAPIIPAKEFQGKSQGGPFGDFVHQTDWTCGQVLDALAANGFAENTLVIFTADNGPEHYAYERSRKFDHRSMGPLRGLKRDIYEGGHRVPFVVRWPGVVEAGRVSGALVGQIDVMATIAEVVGFQLPTTAADDSLSQLPLLRGAEGGETIRTSIVHNTKANHFAMRQGDWVLVDAPDGYLTPAPPWFQKENGYADNPKQAALFNLREDLGQHKNLIEKHPDKVEELRQTLTRIRKQQGRLTRPDNSRLTAPMGAMVGEVTSDAALVQVRLAKSERLVDGDSPGAAGIVEFMLRSVDDTSNDVAIEQTVAASAERDFIARASFAKLKPGVRYRCTTRIGIDKQQLSPGPITEFQTLPGKDQARPVRFVVVTGMNYAKFHGDTRIDRAQHRVENNTDLPSPYDGSDKHLGYPALAMILRLKPDFFVGTGDNVYYDTPSNPRATTINEMRRKWHEQFIQPRYRELFAAVPTYWEIDDHDYRVDDCDNTGNYEPSPELGLRVMLEQLPYAPAENDESATTYRTHRVSRDLQIWLVENRRYRSPNKTPDGPEKTIWGKAQREWLQRTLQASDAKFKLLISPTPMVGPDDLRKTDNHTNIGGFRHERDAFFGWLKETGLDKQGFYFICGDRHWQYHAVDPTGIEEFSTGALVDANSRLGRKAGDPKSTDPDATIKQPYLQDPASGGFLLIATTPASGDKLAALTFSFHDEQGKVLYEHRKQ